MKPVTIKKEDNQYVKTEIKKICFGVLVGTRNIFNSDLAKNGRSRLLSKLEEMGYAYKILPSSETPTGNIETYEDAIKCANFFKQHSDEIDGVIVSLPNFGDELGIVNTLNESKLNVPTLVHAIDDDNDKVDVKSRRDAFCGKISVCNNFYQYGIKFTDTTYHTCKIDHEVFQSDVERFAAICRVVRGLKNARIGAIGARPGAFQTMRSSEKLLQRAGITVIPVDMSEIFSAANSVKDNNEKLHQKIIAIKQYGSIPNFITEEKIKRQAKFGVAIEDWMEKNHIDAAGVQCWDSLQNNYGCASCLSMSMLGQELIPCACEVDVTGVLSMYALALATLTPSAILDWNNNFGDDRNMCVCTHCGNFPKDFIQNSIEISNLDILGTVLGSENCFGAIKGKVAAGDMTFFRISTDDPAGKIKTYMGEGFFTDDPYGMDGCIAVCKVDKLQKLMKYICKNGFEHHVAMVRGHTADILEEAVHNYLDWETYRHD
ncbi:MAG: fucose isomerase [Bacteroidetes bacterium]|jgi:L-fucose isomerase-like protein|nr:fucose isomerase [Bacteroidota bacterium]